MSLGFAGVQLVPLGPPGSGRGAQVRLLSERFEGDRPEVVRERMSGHQRPPDPLVKLYSSRDQLYVVDAARPLEDFSGAVVNAVKEQVAS